MRHVMTQISRTQDYVSYASHCLRIFCKVYKEDLMAKLYASQHDEKGVFGPFITPFQQVRKSSWESTQDVGQTGLDLGQLSEHMQIKNMQKTVQSD